MPPKAPKVDAPKADHKKHAKAFLELPEFKVKPANFPKDEDANDDVTPFKDNDKP